jgi:TRAP-type C4-dicarboxylate transport system permease small subunit
VSRTTGVLWLQRTGRWLTRIEDALLAFTLILLVVLAFAQVVLRAALPPLRDLLGTDLGVQISWADPLVQHLVLWAALLGAMVATRREKHITIDLVSRLRSPRLQRGLRVLTDLFSAVVCALLARATWRFVSLEREYPTAVIGPIPNWVAESIMPLAFGVMALRFLWLAGARLRSGSAVTEEPAPSP